MNDTELHYDLAGAGRPLTLAHGLLLDRSSWDDQFWVFAQQYTVMRYDLRGWGGSAQEPPAVKRLAEVKAPTLIVVGDLDTPETLEIADTLERGIAGAKKRVIPGTAHHPQMEQPEEFNRVVMDFLSGL